MDHPGLRARAGREEAAVRRARVRRAIDRRRPQLPGVGASRTPRASYYRFALSEAELIKLAAARTQLDVPARISLLSNAWAGVRAGKLKPGVMLKLLPLFDDEPARQVVEQVVAILSSMSIILVEDDARPAFRKFVRARLAKRKKDARLAAEEGGGGRQRRRVDPAAHACSAAMGDLAEDEATLREADEHRGRSGSPIRRASTRTRRRSRSISPRAMPGPTGSRSSSRSRATAKTREDRILALKALGGFDDPALLAAALDASLEDEIRPHEMRYVLGAAFARRTSRAIGGGVGARALGRSAEEAPGSLSSGLVGAAGIACTKAEQEERAAFYGPRAVDIEGAARPLAEALEAASLCAELRANGASSLTRELLNATETEKKQRRRRSARRRAQVCVCQSMRTALSPRPSVIDVPPSASTTRRAGMPLHVRALRRREIVRADDGPFAHARGGGRARCSRR